jgi:hypothetical protein
LSTPNPLLVAAAPSLENVLTALQTFLANLGTDPALIAAKLPGALQVLIGTIELQGPVLASSEIGSAVSLVNTKIESWIASLKALTPAS